MTSRPSPGEEIAEPPTRPRYTVLHGAAGTGKSLVLAERVRRELQRRKLPTRILITCVNKKIATMLKELVVARIPAATVKGLEPNYSLTLGPHTVRISNLDSLPTQLRLVDRAERDPTARWELEAAKKLRSKIDITRLPIPERSIAEFLRTEYHRIIYAKTLTREEYVTRLRSGMRRPLATELRGAIYDAITSSIEESYSWQEQRREALIRLGQNTDDSKLFDLVFVDEAQDFTLSDFELLAKLTKDAQGLFAAGDPAQSLQLGATYRPPGRLIGANRERRVILGPRLSGVYRMASPIVGAVRPIAVGLVEKGIAGIDAEPVSRKAAIRGFRPILLASSDIPQLGRIIKLWEVPGGEVGSNVILPRGPAGNQIVAAVPELDQALRETIWRIKGLEFHTLIWPTSILPRGVDDTDLAEVAYAMLTRAVSRCILILEESTNPSLKAVIGRMDERYLLPLSKQARDLWQSWRTEFTHGPYDPLELTPEADNQTSDDDLLDRKAAEPAITGRGEKWSSDETPKERVPSIRAGTPWSPEQDEELVNEYRKRRSIDALARRFQRTPGAIRSRLKKLGLRL